MTAVAAYADATVGFIKRDVTGFLSYRLRFVSQILGTFFSVTLFYYISRLITVWTFKSPDAYFAFAAKNPSLNGVLSLGSNIQFVHNGQIIEIHD